MTTATRYTLCALALTLAACAAPMAPQPVLAPAVVAEHEPFVFPGTATVTGQAFLRQRNGGVVVGAGSTVYLDPKTPYWTAWWSSLARAYPLTREWTIDPVAVATRRSVRADAEGRFRFDRLPAGLYYVHTEILWTVPGLPPQGGLVGAEVRVVAGETREVTVTW